MLSLLPPSSPHVGQILDMLHDPDQLWSPYGIRSLSLSHPEFGQGENYWKGPIWVQMNYLVLGSLYKVRRGRNSLKLNHVFETVNRLMRRKRARIRLRRKKFTLS